MCFNSDFAAAREAVSPVTVLQAAEAARRADVVVVDPRPAAAITETTGMIPGARNVTLDDIRAGRVPADMMGREVITACEAGPLGAIAAHEFQKQGFVAAYIDGGTRAWLAAGFPTVR